MHTIDLTKHINMRHGVDNGGNTVIGPQRPSGSCNPGPDTRGGGHSGYFSGQQIRGFSQIHASGTGWGKYGQFLLSPQIGLKTGFEEHDSPVSRENPTCCEYSVFLERYGIHCEVASGEHSAIYRFTYPESSDSTLLLDMAHSIPLMAGLVNTPSKISASDIRLDIAPDGCGNTVLTGSGIYAGGFGGAHGLHFYAVVDRQPLSFGVYDGDGLREGCGVLQREALRSREESAGGYLRFDTREGECVSVKLGVSFTDVKLAKQWLEQEIPAWDYEAVREEGREAWNRELHRYTIEGENVSDADRMKFYTAVYHTLCMPRDRTGDLPGFAPEVPMMDDHYATWDTWRTLYPLYALVRPDLVRKTVASYIARYEKSGYVRDSFIGGVEMLNHQGGEDTDNVICDAYVKGVEGIDWQKAYRVVRNHAMNFRTGWYSEDEPKPDPNAPYYRVGYIPDDYAIPGTDFGPMACSFTLEHAYNDHCAATLARDLGTPEEYETFKKQSENWKNLWNPDLKCDGFTGFIGPRRWDGTWVDMDPGVLCGSWEKHFYEATGYNYSFFVPQDIPGLIERCGGEDAFIARLLHGMEAGLVDYDNEPAFLASFLFCHTKKPWLTSDCVELVRRRFTLAGPPGNDDSGAMSSWYIFAGFGFFPNAGQDTYFLTSPWHDRAVMRLPDGAEIEVLAHDLSPENRYIRQVFINGQRWHSAMIRHDMIKNGAVLEFYMGPDPVDYTQ